MFTKTDHIPRYKITHNKFQKLAISQNMFFDQNRI